MTLGGPAPRGRSVAAARGAACGLPPGTPPSPSAVHQIPSPSGGSGARGTRTSQRTTQLGVADSRVFHFHTTQVLWSRFPPPSLIALLSSRTGTFAESWTDCSPMVLLCRGRAVGQAVPGRIWGFPRSEEAASLRDLRSSGYLPWAEKPDAGRLTFSSAPPIPWPQMVTSRGLLEIRSTGPPGCALFTQLSPKE